MAGASASSGVDGITATMSLKEANASGYYWQVRDRHGNVIGYMLLNCASFPRHSIQQCSGTLVMPLGKVSASGPVRFFQNFQLTVVGGSGTYADTPSGTLLATKGHGNRWSLGVILR